MQESQLFCSSSYSLADGLSQSPFSFSSNSSFFVSGGLFLEPTISESFLLSVSPRKQVAIGVSGSVSSSACRCKVVVGGGFLSVSLRSGEKFRETKRCLVQNEYEGSEEAVVEETKEEKVRLRGGGAVNTTKHLWSGAIAAMVSRSVSVVLRSAFLLGWVNSLSELFILTYTSQGILFNIIINGVVFHPIFFFSPL